MFQYELHLLCPHCGNFHDLFVRVTLDESFEVRSAKDAYQGEVPPELQAFVGQTCPITGEPIEKPMIDGLVLVAAGRWPSQGEPRP